MRKLLQVFFIRAGILIMVYNKARQKKISAAFRRMAWRINR